MRQKAGALNRTWLIIIGVIVFAGGLLGLLMATGTAARMAGMAAANDQVFPTSITHAFNASFVAVVLAIIGIILVLLGLAWIIAQIPRKNMAKPYRLQHDAEAGITSCSPNVLGRAAQNQVEQLPGVSKAASVVRGAATAPELILRLTATERADIQAIVTHISNEVADDFTAALESPLERLGVEIDISASRTSNTSVTL